MTNATESTTDAPVIPHVCVSGVAWCTSCTVTTEPPGSEDIRHEKTLTPSEELTVKVTLFTTLAHEPIEDPSFEIEAHWEPLTTAEAQQVARDLLAVVASFPSLDLSA